MRVVNHHINNLRNSTGTVTVLHVEDNEFDITITKEQLSQANDQDYTVEACNTLNKAIEKLSFNSYDIIFLDLNLPDSNGISTLKTIRRFNSTLPIIILTDYYDDTVIQDVISQDAQDYIHKDELCNNNIHRIVHHAIERKKTELELKKLAHHDLLTKLSNRSIFMDRLKHALENYNRGDCESYVVIMLLNLDNFKKINDNLGHGVGDALLIQVSNRLKGYVRNNDTVARLGGDEFTILFENVSHLNSISSIANKILTALSEPFIIDNHPIFTSTSIGIASTYDEKTLSAEVLLKNADTAMNNAKIKGGNNLGFFTRELQVSAQIRNNLEQSLRAAIKNDDLHLHFQPQINIETDRIYGAEALLRWNHPEHGAIPPTSFIPALEDNGFIIQVTEWVIQKSLSYWQNWLKEKVVDNEMHISINIPAQYINQTYAAENIKRICSDFKVKTSQIELEITENTLVDISLKNLERLNSLRDYGFHLTIDDFGTGYSSLSYLKAFPIDSLKLDRLFIKDIIESETDEAIAETMISLCKKIGVNLIAEGVDSKEKLYKLRSLGCELIQGFYFSKPLDHSAFQEYIKEFKSKTEDNKKAS